MRRYLNACVRQLLSAMLWFETEKWIGNFRAWFIRKPVVKYGPLATESIKNYKHTTNECFHLKFAYFPRELLRRINSNLFSDVSHLNF